MLINLRGERKKRSAIVNCRLHRGKVRSRKKLAKNRSYSCEENIGLHFIILLKCKMYRRRRRKPIVILQVYVNIFL